MKTTACYECGRPGLKIQRNGLTEKHDDLDTDHPCIQVWICSRCDRDYDGHDLPIECECGHRPAPSTYEEVNS